MKKSRFSEEQIISFLKQAEAGLPIEELCRKGWFQRCHLLKVAGQFRRHGRARRQAPA